MSTANCDAAATALQDLIVASLVKSSQTAVSNGSYACQQSIMNALAVQAAVCGHDSIFPRFSNPRTLQDLCSTFGINLLIPTVQLGPTATVSTTSAVPVEPVTSATFFGPESTIDPSPAAVDTAAETTTADSAKSTSSTSKPAVIIPSAKPAPASPSATVSAAAAASAVVGSNTPPAGIPTAGIVGITFGILILGLIAAIVYSRKKKRAVRNQELVFSSNQSTSTMELESRRGNAKKMAFAEKGGEAGGSVRYAPPVNSSHGKQ
ncbi:hypothetical protein HDU81_010795 [Chytriomyces hyalinus]|nr:hypothetical protein HDU81_010795 [Chytriomyces hyalinus]